MTRAQSRHARAVPAILGSALAIAVAVGSILIYLRPSPAAPAAAAPADAASTHAAHSGPARPARPVRPARRLRPDPLGGRATSFLATRGGTVQAAVYDMGTRQTWTVGHGPPQAEASIVKLDILETVLAQRGRDGRGLFGQEGSLARLMIEESDNSAATDLWNAAGGARGIGSFNRAARLTRTSPSPCVVCSGFPWPGWGLTTTTPADQISLLRQVAEQGRLLSAADRGYAVQLMEDVTPDQRWGVSGGVGPRATVALKDGWLPLNDAGTDWQVNSIGWISGGGRDYLVAVLTTGNPTEQYGIDTIGRLSAIIWKSMGGRLSRRSGR